MRVEDERGNQDDGNAPDERALRGCDRLVAFLRDAGDQRGIDRPHKSCGQRKHVAEKVETGEVNEIAFAHRASTDNNKSRHCERETAEEANIDGGAVTEGGGDKGREQRRCRYDHANGSRGGEYERNVFQQVICGDARRSGSSEECFIRSLFKPQDVRAHDAKDAKAKRESQEQYP